MPSSLRIVIRLRSNRPSAIAAAARCWLSRPSASTSTRVYAVERGDQVGREPLRDLRVRRQQMLVVGVEAVGAVARRPAHRLDARADHEILVSGADAHRRERDRLLARAAEPVQRDAGDRDRPAGIEHGHAADVVGVVAGVGTVAAHDVVDVGGIESDPVAETVEHLPEHLLRVQVGEAALALLADAAR